MGQGSEMSQPHSGPGPRALGTLPRPSPVALAQQPHHLAMPAPTRGLSVSPSPSSPSSPSTRQISHVLRPHWPLGAGFLLALWGLPRLWVTCKAGSREGLEGAAEYMMAGEKEGGCQGARQALDTGAAEALGNDIPGCWETAAAEGMGGGISIPEGSPGGPLTGTGRGFGQLVW